MASEWARKKAELLREEIWGAYESACEADAEGCEHTPDGDPLICWSCRERKFELVAESRIAAALDEARAEGRAEALGDAIPLKDLMAEALAAARAEGAERERWECHQAVTETNLPDTYSEPALEELAARIAARGPMRGPEEG